MIQSLLCFKRHFGISKISTTVLIGLLFVLVSFSAHAGPKTIPTNNIISMYNPDSNGVLYVKKGSTGTGTSWSDAIGELSDALAFTQNANSSVPETVKEIWVSAGEYLPVSGQPFNMQEGVKIYGGFAATGTPAFADRNWQTNQTILKINNGPMLIFANNLSAASLLDGFAADGMMLRGVLTVQGGAPVLNNMVIKRGNRFNGGGVYFTGTAAVLSNTIISDCITGNGTLTGAGGGGIYIGFGSATLKNVLITRNVAYSVVGGSTRGDGMCIYSSDPTLINVTVSDNGAGISSPGIYVDVNSNPVIRNSIVWNNRFTKVSGAGTTISNSIVKGSGGSANWNNNFGTNGGGNFDVDPQFTMPGNYVGTDYTLLPSSQGINTGITSYFTDAATSTDLNGNPRWFANTIDMGAYENQTPVTKQPDASGILYVRKGNLPPGTVIGHDWNHALGELTEALSYAASANAVAPGSVHQIWVSAGDYYPNSGQPFNLQDNLKIYGGFAAAGSPAFADRNWKANVTSLRTNGNVAIQALGLSQNAVLDGFTGRHGNSFHSIVNANSGVLNNMIITGGNSGNSGGGAYLSGNAVLSNAIVTENICGNGFLVSMGIYGAGGGIYIGGGSPTLRNVLVANNDAAGHVRGDGICIYNANPSLINVTVAENSGSSGSGIYVDQLSNPTIRNSIVWGNRYTVVSNATATVTNTILPNGLNPQFVLQTNAISQQDFRLQLTSPAVNTGDISYFTDAETAVDLNGNPRVYGSSIDMGAYERQPSANADLTSLVTTADAMTPIFAAATLSYSAETDTSVTTTTVTAVVAQQLAIIQVRVNSGAFETVSSGSPSSALSLNLGSNTIEVKVTAENGSTVRTYTLTVVRGVSANVNLSSLSTTVGNIAFTPDNTEYTINTNQLSAMISAACANPYANVSINWTENGSPENFNLLNSGTSPSIPLQLGWNNVDVIVTSQAGTTKVYTLHIFRLSTDTSLLSLTSNVVLTNNSSSSYSANVYDNNPFLLNATPTDIDATLMVQVNGEGYSAMENGVDTAVTILPNGSSSIVEIKVTAADGITEAIYTITVSRLSTDNTLSSLSTSAEATAFFPEVENYNVTTIESSITITATMTNAFASMVAENGSDTFPLTNGMASATIPLIAGINEISIIVTSQAGTIKTYTITVERSIAADLSALTTSAGVIPFTSEILHYDLTTGSASDNMTITPVAAEAGAIIQVQVNGEGFTTVSSGNMSDFLALHYGNNLIEITVTGFGGATKTYTITVYRPSGNADLSSLTTTAGAISFNPAVTSYSLSVIGQMTNATVTPTLADFSATQQIRINSGNFNSIQSGATSASIPLAVGNNIVQIRVIAEDTSIIKTYTLTITRPEPIPGAIVYVRKGSTGNGTSWNNAFGELSQALAYADSANASTPYSVEQIWVSAGTYRPQSIGMPFIIKDWMKLYGGFPATGNPGFSDRNWKGNETQLRGFSGNVTLFNNCSSETVLDGFTVAFGGGNGNSTGGCISVYSGAPVLRNLNVHDGVARSGGGITLMYSNATLSNTIVSRCQTSNSAGTTKGGGIFIFSGNVSLTNVLVTDNYSSDTAIKGIGICFEGTQATLTNVTVAYNGSLSFGGTGKGIFIDATSNIQIRNSIVWNNNFVKANGGTVNITNSMIAGSGGSGNWNAAFGNNSGGNLDTDPQFTDPYSDYTLQATSPAFNTGNSAFFTNAGSSVDLAGNPRVFGTAIDMGAYERQSYGDCFFSTTWNGSAWSNGTPTSNEYSAIIAGPFSSTADLTACSLTVNSGAVTVNPGHNFIIKNGVNVLGGSLTFENNANLIQTSQAANSGNITVKRDASMRRLDYVYWGSPVIGQDLKLFSPQTLSPPLHNSRFYTLDETTNGFSIIPDPAGVDFVPAKGYMIRAPNNYPSDNPALFHGAFTGVPNNGIIIIPITNTLPNGQGYNLIANPYPSPISADLFLAQNPGALYFWTHTTQGAARGANYATYTNMGYVAAEGGEIPNGTIQTGQGFILKTAVSGDAVFTNMMRVNNNSGQFFRTANDGKSRMWLNLADNQGMLNQILIGYSQEATMGFDIGIDAKQAEGGISSISSIVNNENYTIQGRASFEVADTVPLYFNALVNGNYSIALDHFDGLFAEGQDIFIKDNFTGSTHNIKNSPYEFASAAGSFADRFSIVYQNNTLGTGNPQFDGNAIVVYKNDNKLMVNSGTTEMSSISIFDISGRLIHELHNINSNNVQLDFNAANQVLLIQVTDVEGRKITKKVIY